jgi:hypothetical protein
MLMRGRRADGKRRLVRVQCGLRPAGSTGVMDM